MLHLEKKRFSTLLPPTQTATSALHQGTSRDLPRSKTYPSPESKANCPRKACGKPHILPWFPNEKPYLQRCNTCS